MTFFGLNVFFSVWFLVAPKNICQLQQQIIFEAQIINSNSILIFAPNDVFISKLLLFSIIITIKYYDIIIIYRRFNNFNIFQSDSLALKLI